MPYRSATHKLYDSGDYPRVRATRRRRDRRRRGAARSRRGEPDGRLIGVGIASYTEQSAHGTAEWVARGLPVVFGFEPALARFTPDGKLLLYVGIQNHGQGLETTLAQVAPAGTRHRRSRTSSCGTATVRSRPTAWARSPRAA